MSGRSGSHRVSVVMGTYDGAAYVGEQLDSILTQTVSPCEVLVSDDGSADDTLAVVASIAKTSAVPVRIHRNERRLGFADNFLSAAGRAEGDLIAFSDQDDRWRPHKLETGIQVLDAYGAVLCSHRVGRIDEVGRSIPSPERVLGGNVLTRPGHADPWANYYGFTMLFRRSLLDFFPMGRRGSDTHDLGTVLSHDRWLYFLASTFGRMVRIDEELADYRQHGEQLYGGEVSRSLRNRISTKLIEGERQALDLAEVSSHRARLLSEVRAAGTEGHLAAAAAHRWSQCEVQLRRSAEVCNGDLSPAHRIVRFVRNCRSGTYGQFSDGGLGRRRGGQDAVIAALPRCGRITQAAIR